MPVEVQGGISHLESAGDCDLSMCTLDETADRVEAVPIILRLPILHVGRSCTSSADPALLPNPAGLTNLRSRTSPRQAIYKPFAISRFRILPLGPIGNDSTNSTRRGYL